MPREDDANMPAVAPWKPRPTEEIASTTTEVVPEGGSDGNDKEADGNTECESGEIESGEEHIATTPDES